MKGYILLAFAVAVGVCFAATTYDLANGNVTVPANTTATITQSNNKKSTTNTISIGDGATVTLSGVNISNAVNKSCITCTGNATLILADGATNKVISVSTSSYDYGYDVSAIAQGPKGKTLTIKGETRGNGYLYAKATGAGFRGCAGCVLCRSGRPDLGKNSDDDEERGAVRSGPQALDRMEAQARQAQAQSARLAQEGI